MDILDAQIKFQWWRYHKFRRGEGEDKIADSVKPRENNLEDYFTDRDVVI